MDRRPSVLAWTALLLALAPFGCSGGPGKTTDGATETSVGSSSGMTTDATATSDVSASPSSSSAGTSSGGGVGACESPTGADDPWLEALEPGPEPCELAAAEGCITDDALPGFRECLGYEIVEDMTAFRWGPCMPSCDPDLADSARACGPGEVGVSYCDDLWVEDETQHVWYPCLDPACLACAPGETELCGPDTLYPETLKTCFLDRGIPAWFAGDCYT